MCDGLREGQNHKTDTLIIMIGNTLYNVYLERTRKLIINIVRITCDKIH